MRAVRYLIAAIAAASAFGCASTSQLQAREELTAAVKTYESGEYEPAMKRLEAAVALGLTRSDEVRAHKYLAFIHCIARREVECRYEFRLALALDPTFDLRPEEAGHPLWGPVFREAKAHR